MKIKRRKEFKGDTRKGMDWLYFTDEGKEIRRNKEIANGGRGKICWRCKNKNGEKLSGAKAEMKLRRLDIVN